MRNNPGVRLRALVAVLVVGGLLAGIGAWLYHWRRDPARYARLGDRLSRAGDYSGAAAAYARAVRLHARDPETYLKLARTLRKLPPAPLAAALKRTQQMVSALEHTLEISPERIEVRRELLAYYFHAAEAVPTADGWRLLAERVRTLSQSLKRRRLAPDPMLERFAVLADAHLARLGRTPSLREAAAMLARLNRLADREPKSPAVFSEQVEWGLIECRRLRAAGKTPALMRTVQSLQRMLEPRFRARSGEEAELARLLFVRLALAARWPRKDWFPVLTAATERLKDQAGPDAARRAAALWIALPAKDAAERAANRKRALEILARAHGRHPAAPGLAYDYAMVSRAAGRIGDAAAVLQSLFDGKTPIPVGPTAVAARYIQPLAGLGYARLLLDQAANENARTGTARTALEQAARVIQRLAAFPRLASQLPVLRARLAAARGNPQNAVALLYSLEKPAPEAVRFLVRLLSGLGEIGAALDRQAALVRSEGGPGRAPAADARTVIGLLLAAGRPEQAARRLRTLANTAGPPPDAPALEFVIRSDLARMKDIEGDPAAARRYGALAMKQFEALRRGTPPPALWLRAVRTADWFGQTETARKLLAAARARFPKNLPLLRLAVILDIRSGNEAAARKRILDALAGRAKNPAARRAVAFLKKNGAPADVLPLLLPEGAPAPWRQLALAQFDQAHGKIDAARQRLRRLLQTNPEPGALDRALRLAVDWGDAEFARKLLAEPAMKRLDPAARLLAEARLAVMQKNLDAARKILTRAAQARPWVSEIFAARGRVEALAGRPGQAEKAWENGLALRPNSTPLLTTLAAFHLRRGRTPLALEEWRRAVFFAPEDLVLFQAYLDALEQTGAFKEAIRLRRVLLARAPAGMRNRRALAFLLARAGQVSQAENLLRETLQRKPSPENALALARFLRTRHAASEGRTLLEKLIEKHHGQADEVEYRLALARFLADAALDANAISAFRRAAALEDPKTRPVSRELAGRLLRNQRIAEAVTLYRRLVHQLGDAAPGLRVSYAAALAAAAKYIEARSVLDQYARKHGETVETLLLRALIARRTGRRAEALKFLSRAAAAAPADPRPYYLRAQLQMTVPETDRAKARADIDKALELDPLSIAARELSARWFLTRTPPDFYAAASELHRLIQAHPGYLPARIELAEVYLRAGKLGRFQRFLDACRRLRPDLPVWHRLEASGALAKNDIPAALAALKAYFGKTRSAESASLYAGALLEAGRAKEALAVLDGLSLPRPPPRLVALRAWALAAAGKRSEAEKLFSRAVSAAPPAALAPLLGWLERALGPKPGARLLESLLQNHPKLAPQLEPAIAGFLADAGRFHEAEKRYAALLARASSAPEKIALLRRIADIRYRTGRFQEAADAYRRILGLAPADPVALNNLAALLANELGQPRNALALARKAVDAAPPYTRLHADALDTLGWTQYRLNEKEAARAAIEKSVQEFPAVSNHVHWARLLLDAGEKAKAKAVLAAAERLARAAGNNTALQQIHRLQQKL